MYSILSHLGISSAYATVLELLKSLSQSARETVRTKARTCGFLLVYDNINRMARAWDPDLGQKDTIQNGTAATFVELADCDLGKAFDAGTLWKS